MTLIEHVMGVCAMLTCGFLLLVAVVCVSNLRRNAGRAAPSYQTSLPFQPDIVDTGRRSLVGVCLIYWRANDG